ncbi:hypothetical protein [Flavobacterium proteolyticum]|uniref:Uncharacterized protein n=1 Tax=Flavobacterium proteolyticum TaxID=2911683 RepID=A0ABR9WMN5_9FLAO|nr:hypothetical protein [Flavobacterium proteolyticum]MBE9575180.1 hypothetical protein [Flavobacterium proteolyticum]
MKKIFFSLVLFFTFSTLSFAQDQKSNDPKMAAKLELNELVKEIPLESNLENGMYSLLIYKHETLAKATSDKERNKVYETMKSKIEGSLSPAQLKKLKNNKKLYENLIK